MSKDKKTKEKSTKKALIILISALAICFLAGYIVGKIMGKGIVTMLKEELMSTARTKMGAVLAKPALANLKKRMDYSDYGGAPLLGVNGVSIVCHGSSNAKAVSNGIKAAMVGAESGFVQKITDLMPQA